MTRLQGKSMSSTLFAVPAELSLACQAFVRPPGRHQTKRSGMYRRRTLVSKGRTTNSTSIGSLFSDNGELQDDRRAKLSSEKEKSKSKFPQPRATGAAMKFSLQQARLAQVSETSKPALNIPAILTIP
jgi:hypothetical protein